jgi:eukaryotic sulfide quinone oxidoreductase
MATGVELRYDLIDGAMDALMDPEAPVGSMYRLDLAHKMSRLREGFTGGKAVFTLPVMPVKCGGAPQKIMYLSEETWRKNGVRANADIHFYTSVGNMFPNCKKFADALYPIAQSKNIDVHFNHVIKSVDGANRTVTFAQGEESVTTDFDLLHVVPPQTAHQFVRESSLAAGNGFIDVDQHTLRHNKYGNVFALGDVANLPTAKTAAAIFAQAPVVTQNLINLHKQNTNASATYSGYSSCPLFVGDSKLMLMEFKYDAVADETFSNKQDVPTRPFFWLKKHFFPYAYWKYMP